MFAQPGDSFYEQVGGHETFVRLVRAFYEGVAQDEPLRALYPEEDLGPAEVRLRMFLEQYFGGPHTYSEQRGHPAGSHRPGTHHEHPTAGEVQTQGVGHGRGTPEATAERKPPCYVRVRALVPGPSRGVTLPRTGLTRSRRPASSSP